MYAILDDAARRARSATSMACRAGASRRMPARWRRCGSLTGRCPPSERRWRADARAARPADLAGDHRHRRPAVFRLRHRRRAAAGAGGQLARGRLGSEHRPLHESRPGTAYLETVALRWLLELFELPADSGGAFVTGATVANFTALAAARNAVLARVGWNVEAHGLFGAPPITVLTGEEAHPTLLKSLGMLGLGRARIVRVRGRCARAACAPMRCRRSAARQSCVCRRAT